MLVEININEECITKGKPFSIWYSPLAIAVRNTGIFKEDLNSYIVCTADRVIGYLRDTDTKCHITLPDVVKRWTRDFDSGKKVKPLTLKVDL